MGNAGQAAGAEDSSSVSAQIDDVAVQTHQRGAGIEGEEEEARPLFMSLTPRP